MSRRRIRAISGSVPRQNTSPASELSEKLYRWNRIEGTEPLKKLMFIFFHLDQLGETDTSGLL